MSNKHSGILLHISSLDAPYGVGDLGPSAYAFIDFLSKSGQRYWQILPLNPTDGVTGNSPYSSCSAFAGNFLFISPQLLYQAGWIAKDEYERITVLPPGRANYQQAQKIRIEILSLVYERFKMRRDLPADFGEFCHEHKYWLDDYALFMVIKDFYGQREWDQWPEELRNRQPKALEEFELKNQDALQKIKCIQYLFYQQWSRLKQYGHERKVKIIGDIPIYVSYDSADVWAHQALFKLDPQGRLTVVAGVPPDYFSQTGQRWGNPVYDWGKLKATRFDWWIKRFKHNFRLFDMIRVDHFRAFVNHWEIPASERTAVKGNWVENLAEEFFGEMRRQFTVLPIIAEDLGLISDSVRAVITRLGYPGMKILLFAFGDGVDKNMYLPHHYDQNCVVYTGTHDNNTVVGWYQQEATAFEKENIKKYIELHYSAAQAISAHEPVNWQLNKMALYSEASLCILPMQDILGLDAAARMNIPSTIENNWQWQLKSGQINTSIAFELRKICQDAGRC